MNNKMEKFIYQRPELTTVSFKAERGFALSEQAQTMNAHFNETLAVEQGQDGGKVGDGRTNVTYSGDNGWATGWTNDEGGYF